MRRGSISYELLMCAGGVGSILLLHLVAKCLETIDVSGMIYFWNHPEFRNFDFARGYSCESSRSGLIFCGGLGQLIG